MQENVERIRVHMPEKFDPKNTRMVAAVVQSLTGKYGAGWEFEEYEPLTNKATFTRPATSDETVVQFRLGSNVSASDGQRVAERVRDMYDGYYLTMFNPYQGIAERAKLTEKQARVRDAISALLSVKPWEVRVTETDTGMFIIGLPTTKHITESHKHSFDQIAQTIAGGPGWFATVDARTATAKLIPAQPPSFAHTIPYPFTDQGVRSGGRDGDVWKIPVGQRLGERGKPNTPLYLDLSGGAGVMVSGTAGGGKAQPLDAPITVPVSEKFPDGVARVRDLTAGDLVCTPTGTARLKSKTAPSEETIYTVSFENAPSVECSGNHLWRIYGPHLGPVVTPDPNMSQYLRELAAEVVGCAGSVDTIANLTKLDHGLVRATVTVANIPVVSQLLPDGEHDGGLKRYPIDEAIIALADLYRVGRVEWSVWTAKELLQFFHHLDGGEYGVMAPESDGARFIPITGVVRDGRSCVMQCLCLDSPEHMYLTHGNIPTHNSVSINAIIYGALARGWELAVGDTFDKSIDFTWVKPFVREYGWGCDSPAHVAAMLDSVYQLKNERAQLLREYGASKIQELPEDVRPRPVLVVVDELTALAQQSKLPAAKGTRIYEEAVQANYQAAMIIHYIQKIPQELRFVGIRLLIATQVAQAQSGIDNRIKTNMQYRMLLGSRPTDAQRRHSLANPDDVPRVPDCIRDDKAMARGTGVFEFEGDTPGVFKSYFAPVDEYVSHLEKLNLPSPAIAAPTPGMIDKLFGDDEDEPGFGHGERTYEPWELDSEGKPLTGFEYANAARRQLDNQ